MQNNFTQTSVQQQNQQQLQQLTPHQLQGLQILAAPLQELETMLFNELESNPLLELTTPREELAGDPLAEVTAAGNELNASEFEGDREEFPILEQLSDIWDDSGDVQDDFSGREQFDLQKKHDFCFDSLTTSRTLVDILFEQLDFCVLAPKEYRAAELVIGSLDERGFLTTALADIAMIGNLTLDETRAALELVQSFDPPGVAARDTAECWMLQLKRRNHPDLRIYRLLTECRDDLEHNRLPKIAKTLDCSINDIYSMLEVLKSLNNVPAVDPGNKAHNINITPEMSIELEHDQITVIAREDFLPKLGIVQHYLKLLDDPSTPEDTCKYLREKLANAENLLKSLELRKDTLTRITQVIAVKQADFFRYGTGYLQPMTMAEVAQELDLNDSTVSRAVANKYLDTPQGLKEYRFFFSGGYKNADGSDVSSRSVKELIRTMIENEDPKKPLSDASIANNLAQQGLDIARRTVAKYRESMNIAPTNLRRRH